MLPHPSMTTAREDLFWDSFWFMGGKGKPVPHNLALSLTEVRVVFENSFLDLSLMFTHAGSD